MDKTRILVVDDHALLREGIRLLLGKHNDVEIVGEASDGKEAIEKAAELLPDIAIIDIGMPIMDGLEATRRIIKSCPKTKVLILTQHDNAEYVLSAVKAGASGYLTKRSIGLELVSAIRSVKRGECYLYPSAATVVVRDYLRKAIKEPYDSLTNREREITKLIACGHTSREIGATLHISLRTVHGHRTKIMKKLDIHNRTKLIRYGMHKGLVSIDT
ncbi:MAG: response regulator transcription factor [Dehalococcoidales bacterium]|nr:response regulator transcription factor [Dehalococcoidales bacterium]